MMLEYHVGGAQQTFHLGALQVDYGYSAELPERNQKLSCSEQGRDVHHGAVEYLNVIRVERVVLGVFERRHFRDGFE